MQQIQLQQQNGNRRDPLEVLEAFRAMHDQRERRIQEDHHERQMSRTRDALKRTSLQGCTGCKNGRSKPRDDPPAVMLAVVEV